MDGTGMTENSQEEGEYEYIDGEFEVRPFDEYDQYYVALEISELVNIRKDEKGFVIADTRTVKIPEGTLFVREAYAAVWDDIKDGFKVCAYLVPAFYKSKRAWVLEIDYEEQDLDNENEDEWLFNEEILTFEQGLELYRTHI